MGYLMPKPSLENNNSANVTYWPSTELSIKRCTCVNKRKNSRSKWVWDNNITRLTNSQLETRYSRENQRQTEGFGPSVTHGWPRWGRSAAMVRRTWGQCSSLSLSATHLSHTTNITLSRIKCERLYFYKECSFIEVRHYCWLCFCIYLYMYVAIQD